MNNKASAESRTVDSFVVSEPILRVLCETTVALAEIRQRGCNHLSVENFAPECLRNLLDVVNVHTHNH